MYKSDQELNIVPMIETRFDLKMPELAQTETMDDNLNESEASSVTATSLKIKPIIDSDIKIFFDLEKIKGFEDFSA